MRTFIVLCLTVSLVAGTAIRKTDEITTRKRRDISDFHRDFLREVKALQQIRNQCLYDQYLDLTLLQCKGCVRYCPDNECGQCREYYSAKKSFEENEVTRLKSEGRDMREIVIWTFLVLLLVGLVAIFIRLGCKTNHTNAPIVTTDSCPHDINKPNPQAQQPENETYRGLIKANREAAENDNRHDEEAAENDNRHDEEAAVPLANTPQPVCQPDQDGNCQELFS